MRVTSVSSGGVFSAQTVDYLIVETGWARNSSNASASEKNSGLSQKAAVSDTVLLSEESLQAYKDSLNCIFLG